MPISIGGMASPLIKRLRMADRAAETRTDRGVMARTMMYPYALGGVLALVAAAGGADLVRLTVTATVCWSVAALLLATYDAMPAWSFPILTAIGTGLLLWGVSSGQGSTTFKSKPSTTWSRARRAGRTCTSGPVEAPSAPPFRSAAPETRRV